MLGNKTYREIMNQPDLWRSILGKSDFILDRLKGYLGDTLVGEVVFVGCGSSYNLGMVASSLLRKMLGLRSRALAASEVLFYPDCIVEEDNTLYIGISRSGETTETLAAMKYLSSRPGARMINVSCNPGSTFSRLLGLDMSFGELEEKSVVMTGSFTSLLLAIEIVVAKLVQDRVRIEKLERLPELLMKALAKSEEVLKALALDPGINQVVFLGSGPLFGIACESALKMTEMALSTAHAYHTLEFRHGPKSTVDSSSLIVLLPSDRLKNQEGPLLKELVGYGAKTVSIAWHEKEAEVVLDAEIQDLDDWSRAPVYAALMQVLAYYKATAKGVDPDVPRHLSYSVKIPLPDYDS